MSEYNPNDWGIYKNSDIKKAITNIFTRNEFVTLIRKINECNPNTFINHSFQNEGNCVKIYNYLRLWRGKYWAGEDMSDFLCGMIRNIRRNRNVAVNSMLSNISDKTNNDISRNVEEYIRGGVKKKKKNQQKKTIRKQTNKRKY